jgi:hypothetical protein
MHEADPKAERIMRGIAVAIVLVLSTIQGRAQSTPSAGQNTPSSGQCDQIRAAITQHGLEAARKHALANHGLSRDDLRTIEQSCGVGQREGRAKR